MRRVSEQGPVEAQLHIQRSRDTPQPPVIYSNSVVINFTPEDFTLHFGHYNVPPLSEPPTSPINVEIEPVARVVLPVNLVPNVVALLQRQMQGYEESFDTKIPDHPNRPPWMTEAMEEAADA